MTDLSDNFQDEMGDDFDRASILPRRRRVDDAEMDVTPMIDVTFLLLIFFIVCAVTDQQSSVTLAKARHGEGVSERDSVVFLIQEGGVDGAPVSLEKGNVMLSSDAYEQEEEIRQAVLQGQQDELKQHVLIKADRNVACRDVEQVIKGVSKVKGMQIHLAVLEEE